LKVSRKDKVSAYFEHGEVFERSKEKPHGLLTCSMTVCWFTGQRKFRLLFCNEGFKRRTIHPSA